MFKDVIWSFVKFGGQTSKMFKSLPLRHPRLSWWGLAYLDMVRVFVLGETDVEVYNVLRFTLEKFEYDF